MTPENAARGEPLRQVSGASASRATGDFPQLDDPTGFVTAVSRFIAGSEPWAYDTARVRELMLAGPGGR